MSALYWSIRAFTLSACSFASIAAWLRTSARLVASSNLSLTTPCAPVISSIRRSNPPPVASSRATDIWFIEAWLKLAWNAFAGSAPA